jgi:hypothetical protein
VFTRRDQFFGALKKAFGGNEGLEFWYDNTWRKGLPDGVTLPAPMVAYYADGYLGQYLVVIPKHRLVAVRQLRVPAGETNASKAAPKVDSFGDFVDMVRALVP